MVQRACDTLPRSINTTELSASINKLWGFQSKQKEHNIHNKNVYINTMQIISSGKKPQCIQVRLLHYEIRLTFCPLALVHTCLTVWNSQVATKNCKSSYSHSSYRQSGIIQNFFIQTFPKKIILNISRLSNKGSKETFPALTNAGTKLFPWKT